MSSPEFVLTSPSQPSRLGDSLVLNNTSVGCTYNELPAKVAHQTEEIRAHEVATKKRKRVEEPRYRDEWQEGANKLPHTGEGNVESTRIARKGQLAKENQRLEDDKQARQRAWQEQRLKDRQLVESNKLARRRAWDEQRLKDDQLLEGYRVAKRRDAALRFQGDEQRRWLMQAQADSMKKALLQHQASIQTNKDEKLFNVNVWCAL
jgi:hypothetical protein